MHLVRWWYILCRKENTIRIACCYHVHTLLATTKTIEYAYYYTRASFNCVFFSTKKYALYLKKNAILCMFLKNVLPSKREVCFILNNLHFPMVESANVVYALYKPNVMIIHCKSNDFCLFIGLPDEILKRCLISLSNLEFNFFIVLCSNLKETLHY